MRFRGSTLLGAVVLVGLFVPSYAGAATFIVTSSGPSGPGTLREAINLANASSDGSNRIEFDDGVSSVDLAGLPLPAVTKRLEIAGPSGQPVAIDGEGADWMLRIGDNDLELSELSITGFDAAQSLGGMIVESNAGAVTVSDVTVARNSAANTQGLLVGGMISSNRGDVRIARSTFLLNESSVQGLGQVEGFGGVISANTASVSIIDSTFDSNTLTGGSIDSGTGTGLELRGGAVSSRGDVFSPEFSDQFLRVRGSTFVNNVVTQVPDDSGPFEGFGGAVSANGFDAANSTFSGNEVAGSSASGGAAYAWKVDAVEHVTFASNFASEGSHVTLLEDEAPIVANVFSGTGSSGEACALSLAAVSRFNVSENGSCAAGPQDNLVPSVGLGPLADNGGPTRTHSLNGNSPAIDVAPRSLLRDQRGLSRPVNLAVNNGPGPADAGSVEVRSLGQTCLGQTQTPATIEGGTFFGTIGNDVLGGTAQGQTIRALPGDDLVCARGGDDFVVAGDGNDRVSGGGGADALAGGDGDDVLDAGPGVDICQGGRGRDTFRNCEERT